MIREFRFAKNIILDENELNSERRSVGAEASRGTQGAARALSEQQDATQKRLLPTKYQRDWVILMSDIEGTFAENDEVARTRAVYL